MGNVELVPQSVIVPETARTGDEVQCRVDINNTNVFDWEHFELVWSLYSDPDGRAEIGETKLRDKVWGWPWSVGEYTAKVKFTMPRCHVWLKIELYRIKDGQRTLADSTSLIGIYNPDVPPPEEEGVLRVPTEVWLAASAIGLAAVAVMIWRR